MEFLKELITDWILFSLIEGFIICYIFNKFGRLEKFKLYEIIILAIANCLICGLFPPILYQVLQMMFMSFFNKYKNKKIDLRYIFKVVISSMMFFLISEMSYAIFFEFIIGVDITQFQDVQLFVFMIFVRLFQISILNSGGDRMKFWLGGIKR